MSLLFHETDIETIKATLLTLYGIDCDGIISQPDPIIENIFQTAIDLCNTLPATDESFFIAFFKRDVRDGLLHFLAMDAFAHIRREMLATEQHKSAEQFLKVVDGQCHLDACFDVPNYMNLVKNYFMKSVMSDLLDIHQSAPNCNYTIPKFMDRLAFLLVSTIKKNPYRENTNRTFPALMRFMDESFYSKARVLYQDDDGNQLIANYIVDRIFDVDTMLYIANKTAEMECSLNPNIIISTLAQAFLLPNKFGKRAYCDIMFDILQREKEVSSKLDKWKMSPLVLARITEEKTPVQAQDANLQKCREFISFLTTIYLPVLNHCFFVLLRRAYPELPMAEAKLFDYLQKQDIAEYYQSQNMKRKNELFQLQGKAKNHFCLLYKTIRETIFNQKTIQSWKMTTSIQYIFAHSPYQQAILEAVIKEKLDF